MPNDSEHTPTTATVKDHYAGIRVAGGSTYETADAEFDRWIAEVKAEAWNEGALREAERIEQAEQGLESDRVNPYREGEGNE